MKCFWIAIIIPTSLDFAVVVVVADVVVAAVIVAVGTVAAVTVVLVVVAVIVPQKLIGLACQ